MGRVFCENRLNKGIWELEDRKMSRAKNSSLLGKITVIIVICFFVLPVQAKYGGGTGEPNDPYMIYTADQMNAIGADSNDWDKHFLLCADIDLSGYTGTSFNIIGTSYTYPFTGVFDGNGHTISNFTYCSNGTNCIGLFGFVSGENAEIRNLGLIDPNVDAGTGRCVGSLVGYLRDGTITDCYSTGGIVAGDCCVGGLVGWNSEKGTITNCYAAGSISGEYSVGGLVGGNDDGKISNCYSEAIVSGTTEVGGLVGRNDYGTITNCYSTGSVKGGGVVGVSFRVGGLVGWHSGGEIFNCYSSGVVTGAYAQGLVGEGEYQVHASYWDIDASGQRTSVAGIGKTTAEMQTASSFVSWGCEPVWTIDQGNDYPRLWWENKPGEPITKPSYCEGSGAEEDPYLIYTAEQLDMIGLFPCDLDKHFKLMADIDLDEYTGTAFNPIGYSYGHSFTGVFDGNGHEISNFTFSSTERSGIGIFGYVGSWEGNAEIKDLGMIEPEVECIEGVYIGSLVGRFVDGTITGCYVQGGSVAGEVDVGALVGSSSGNLVNCYAWSSTSGNILVGGLCGHASGYISDCYVVGDIEGSEYVGGLAGSLVGTISDCYTNVNVSGTGDYVGGLGGSGSGHISDCCSVSNISGNYKVGGLLGSFDGKITNCNFSGKVEGRGDIGGIVGTNNGTISRCWSSAEIVGTWSNAAGGNVGGLVGINWYLGEISGCCAMDSVEGYYKVGGLVGCNYYGIICNCYSNASVDGREKVGGLVGSNNGECKWFGDVLQCLYGTISDCYSTGSVTGSYRVGGLVGYNHYKSEVIASFWDIEASGQTSSDGGTGLPTVEMQMQVTFMDAGWDFVGERINGSEDIWMMTCEGMSYPKLNWWQPVLGDYFCPDGVDMIDMEHLALHWLDTGCDETNDYCDWAEISNDSTIDFTDFAILAGNWLAGL